MATFNYTDFEIYDAHSHIFPDKIVEKATKTIGDFYGIPMYGLGTSEKLLESGSKIGVKKYLVCSTATIAKQTQSINNFINEECNKHPEFIGFGTLHPDYENIEDEVNRIVSFGLKGIKIHPDFQKFNIDDKKAYKIYEQIEGKLPILIHMGDDRYTYSHPSRLVKMLKDFPKLQVIAAHFGGYKVWEEAVSSIKSENVKFDTSSSIAIIGCDYAKKLVNKYGVDNLFFGTDYPMWDHQKELERFFGMKLSYEDNKKILSENFKNFISQF